MTPTQMPPPPPAPTSSPPSSPGERQSLVWASLILDIAALAAIVLLAKWHVFGTEVTTGALFTVITGRVVAKAGRGSSGSSGSGGLTGIGGVVAFASGVYALLYRHHGGA